MMVMKPIWLMIVLCVVHLHGEIYRTATDPVSTTDVATTTNVSTTPITINTTIVSEKNVSSVRQIISRGMVSLSLHLNHMIGRTVGKNENIVFAPVNIVKTMATVMLGTGGVTQKEIAHALGWASQIDVIHKLDSIHSVLGTLLLELTAIAPGTKLGTNLNVAAGVFLQTGIQVRPLYMEQAKSTYQCDIMSVDFVNDGSNAVKLINEWFLNKTEGRIKDMLLEALSTDTIILFAGALYFNGDWEHPFLPKYTGWQLFNLGPEGKDSTEKIRVQMMVNSATIPYYQTTDYQALGIPYKNKEIMMYIILPRLNLDLRNLTALLTPEDIRKIIKNSTDTEMVYVIPKMKLQAKINLRSASEQLGIHTLFDPKLANFTNLADGIYADEILHQVEIEINELGTVGTAGTAITISRTSSNTFRADRPFLFFVYNKLVDVVTFWGNVYKPTPFKEY